MLVQAGSDGIPPDSVRAQVQRILAGESFARSERLSRFLRFTTEQALQGNAASLKEFLIGTEVFDKDASFDPRTDTCVRVEARRLRTALLTYYTSAGRNDPIRIEYPKGGYAPVFTLQPPPETGPTQSALPPDKASPLTRLPRLLPYLLVLGAGAGFTYWWAALRHPATIRSEAAPHPAPSIAVLPFADMSPDKDQEYFCDGLTEELIHALTKVDGLSVVARTSSFQFKGQPADIRQVGERLRVGVVLEGSVRKENDSVRITAQLNSAADGYHLWSRTYDRRLGDVFAVQGEIATAVVKTLKMTLATDLPRPPEGGTENLEAHNLYLKGRYFWRRWTNEDRRKSIPYFEQAIAKDPRYALAYVGLADAYGVLGIYGASVSPAEGHARRKAYLAKAFELNDRLSQAYTSRAMAKAMYERDWAGAEQDFRRAIELDPKDPEARDRFATVLLDWGRVKEARRQVEEALRVDPLSVNIAVRLARASYLSHQYDRALEEAKAALELDPNHYSAYEYLGRSYLAKKMPEPAIAAFEKALTVSGNEPAPDGLLGYAYAMAGRRAEAEGVLARMLQGSRRLPPFYAAKVYLALGQPDRALDVLEQSYENRLGRLVLIKTDPIYDPLRSTPRFQNLLKKLALPPGD